MRIAESQYVILCDDVRNELGNKISIMGVYLQEVIVNKIPAFLPKLALVIILEGIIKPFEHVKAKFFLPGAEPMNLDLHAPGNLQKGSNNTMVIAMGGIKISAPGTAKYELYFSNRKKPDMVYEFSIKENPDINNRPT